MHSAHWSARYRVFHLTVPAPKMLKMAKPLHICKGYIYIFSVGILPSSTLPTLFGQVQLNETPCCRRSWFLLWTSLATLLHCTMTTEWPWPNGEFKLVMFNNRAVLHSLQCLPWSVVMQMRAALLKNGSWPVQEVLSYNTAQGCGKEAWIEICVNKIRLLDDTPIKVGIPSSLSHL